MHYLITWFFSLHVCVIFTCLFVIDFWFHSIMVREDTWYGFNLIKFIETCFVSYMWFILENVLCALEKYVYSAVLGWNTLKISRKSIWPSVSFKVTVSLLITCLEDLSNEVIGELKYLTMDIFLSFSPYVQQELLYIFWCPMLGP